MRLLEATSEGGEHGYLAGSGEQQAGQQLHDGGLAGRSGNRPVIPPREERQAVQRRGGVETSPRRR